MVDYDKHLRALEERRFWQPGEEVSWYEFRTPSGQLVAEAGTTDQGALAVIARLKSEGWSGIRAEIVYGE